MTNPTILLSMDTVRQDVFNENCFPKSWPIITSDFTRFPNSLSNGVATPHSFPGIFAGSPVINNGEFTTGATTLAELFDGPTVAFTNNGHLRASRGYDCGVDEFGDTAVPTHQNKAAASLFDRVKDIERVQSSKTLERLYSWYKSVSGSPPYAKPAKDADTVTDWVLAEARTNPPAFLWAHYMDAHKPFIPERAIDGPDVPVSKEKLAYLNDYDREDDPPSQEHLELLWALYEANVRYLDRGLGRALTTFQSCSWYDDALIILVSDHGELFGEHGHMWHPMTIDPVDELIDVPLAVKFPDQECGGEVVDHRVQHSDILATVSSLLEHQTQPQPDTYPVLKSAERLTVSKSNTSIRVTGSDGHVVRRRDGSEDEYGTTTDQMWAAVHDQSFPDVRTSDGVIRGIEDVQRMEQLKALGYR